MRNTKIQNRVVMIGPCLDGKGGMAEAVKNILRSEFVDYYEIIYLATIVRGLILKKIIITMIQLLRFIFICLLINPKLVHIHFCSDVSFYRKSLFVIVSKLFKKPLLLHAHGGRFIEFFEGSLPITQRYIRKILEYSDTLILISAAKLTWMQNLSTRIKFEIIHNTVDLTTCVLKREYTNNKDYFIIIFLGAIEKHKGVFDLIESMPHILTVFPNTKLIVCGEGKIDSAKKLCIRLNIEKQVHFPGWVEGEQKFNILYQADLLVLPSYFEELGIAMLEGMNAALPIVATNIGGPGSILKNRVNGILFSPGNISELSDSIIYLLDNPEIRREMGRRNLKLIEQKFRPERVIPQLSQIYKTIIGS